MKPETVFSIVFPIAAFGDHPPEKDAMFHSNELASESSDWRQLDDGFWMNPDKREQTLKFRPTIKLPPSLKPWLEAQSRRSQSGRVIEFRGAPVASIRTAWRKVRAKLEMDNHVQPYGIRHTMAAQGQRSVLGSRRAAWPQESRC